MKDTDSIIRNYMEKLQVQEDVVMGELPLDLLSSYCLENEEKRPVVYCTEERKSNTRAEEGYVPYPFTDSYILPDLNEVWHTYLMCKDQVPIAELQDLEREMLLVIARDHLAKKGLELTSQFPSREDAYWYYLRKLQEDPSAETENVQDALFPLIKVREKNISEE